MLIMVCTILKVFSGFKAVIKFCDDTIVNYDQYVLYGIRRSFEERDRTDTPKIRSEIRQIIPLNLRKLLWSC